MQKQGKHRDGRGGDEESERKFQRVHTPQNISLIDYPHNATEFKLRTEKSSRGKRAAEDASDKGLRSLDRELHKLA